MNGRKARRAAAALAILVGTLSLSACSSAAPSSAGWTPTPSCPTPAAVTAAGRTAPLAFTSATTRPETLKTSGCSYTTPDNTLQLNVEIDPGPPSQVVFGSAAAQRVTSLPKLGSGAMSAVSTTFCALVVPEHGGNTIQLQIIGDTAHPVNTPCARLTQVVKQFASPPAAG